MGAWAVVGRGLRPLVSQGPEPGVDAVRVWLRAHGVSACASSTHGCAHGGSLPPCRAHGPAPGSHSRIWSSAAHRPPGTRTLPVTDTKPRPWGLPLQEPHTVPDQVGRPGDRERPVARSEPHSDASWLCHLGCWSPLWTGTSSLDMWLARCPRGEISAVPHLVHSPEQTLNKRQLPSF